MPRRATVFAEGLLNRVDNRVGRREAPCALADETPIFWSSLREVARRDGLTVCGFRPNHDHLAVRTATVPLWRSIRYLQHRSTQHVHRRARVLGPL